MSGLRFREPNHGLYMQSGYLPIWMFGVTAWDSTDQGLTGGMSAILESEVICPAASTIMLDQLAADLGSGIFAYLNRITLTGVKRFSKDSCCGEVCNV